MDCDFDAPAKWFTERTYTSPGFRFVARSTIDGRAEGFGNTESEALASARDNDA